MTKNLFAYGTLLVPEIWEMVVGKSFKSRAATLAGYDIFRVKGGDFPGIVLSENEDLLVPGQIFYDLDEVAIARLDAYEDTFYERVEVKIELRDSDKQIQCDTYVVMPPADERVLSQEVWTLEWFQAVAKEAYIGRLQGARF